MLSVDGVDGSRNIGVIVLLLYCIVIINLFIVDKKNTIKLNKIQLYFFCQLEIN